MVAVWLSRNDVGHIEAALQSMTRVTTDHVYTVLSCLAVIAMQANSDWPPLHR